MRWKGRLVNLTLVALAACTFDPNGLGGRGGDDDVLVDAGSGLDARGDDGGPLTDGATPDDATVLVDATPPDAAPPDAARCVGYVASGTSKYKLVTTTRGWVDAEHSCEADGAHLVVIDGDDENTRVGALSSSELWIGLSDRITEGSFMTVNGATPFLPWSGNQPDDFFGEDCVVRYSNGRFNDADCSDIPHAYVCECDGLEVRAGTY
ncbi:MAG: C-type lectin domain-containing protein [Deltaproteobacteria bacterium]|nr:C-type lectin domain-containing protein [Deltaproteobacteria bacterium]